MSGFYGSYIDAFFDTMSGLTTTGLSVIQDLDHAPFSLSTWRHFLQYLGGQGIIVLSLVFLAKSLRGAIKIYFAEARDERLWPNIKETAASIWRIANVYLIIGTLGLFIILLLMEVPLDFAFFHGLWITMSGWGTGGYAPSTLSVQLYHSIWAELFISLVMILGGVNFAIHFIIWRGRPFEIFKNFETRTYLFYTALIFLMVFIGLANVGIYDGLISRFRFTYFQVISAATGTGYSNVSPGILKLLWGEFAILWVAIGMALGPHACSTGGGFKAMRVGITVKGLVHEIKRMINPESSIIFTGYHHLRRNVISDNQVKMAAIIIILYICTYLSGGIIGAYLGYGFVNSLYESVSATANVGLSVGITSPDMPLLLKIIYILQMWLGRLEFSAILAIFGVIYASFKGR
jgi:trk system potassium uptake protein TrkH